MGGGGNGGGDNGGGVGGFGDGRDRAGLSWEVVRTAVVLVAIGGSGRREVDTQAGHGWVKWVDVVEVAVVVAAKVEVWAFRLKVVAVVRCGGIW